MVQLSAFCCHGCSAATAGLDYITVLAIMPHFICFSRNPQGQQKDLVFRPGFLAPQVGLEPTTLRLTAECSAIELLRNMESGGDLLSRTVTSQVPSALKGLTSVFGMGTGGTPSSLPPEMVSYSFQPRGAQSVSGPWHPGLSSVLLS